MNSAEFYDVRKVYGESLSITVENGKVENFSYRTGGATGVRALVRGRWGYVRGDSEADVKKLIRDAERFASVLDEGDSKIKEIESGSIRTKIEPEENPYDVDIETKVRTLKDIEKNLRKDGIINTRVIYFENTRTLEYMDSSGVESYYSVPRIGVILSSISRRSGLMQQYSKRVFEIGGFEIFRKNDFYEMADETADIALKLLSADSPPGGRMKVLLDPGLAGVFVHEALGHAVEGDLILQGNSILKNRTGEVIASEEVNVFDDPGLKEYGFYPFDDEGVPSERRSIIRNGVLSGYLNSRETSVKLGGSGGNGRGEGSSPILVRMSNTFMSEGEWKFEELVEYVKDGVYLIGSRGGQTSPGDGVFQFHAEYGYVIKKGELQGMIRDVSLSGLTLELLKNVRVGEDLRFNPGICGKNGQSVPVSDGAPHIATFALVGGA